MEETMGHAILEDLILANKLFTGNVIGAIDLGLQLFKLKKLCRWGGEVGSSQGVSEQD